jgi:hypothetical protein
MVQVWRQAVERYLLPADWRVQRIIAMALDDRHKTVAALRDQAAWTWAVLKIAPGEA